MRFFKLSLLSLALGTNLIAMGYAADPEDQGMGKGTGSPRATQLNPQPSDNQQPKELSGKAKRRQEKSKRKQEKQAPTKQQQAQQNQENKAQAAVEIQELHTQAGGDIEAFQARLEARQTINNENRRNKKNEEKQDHEQHSNATDINTLWWQVLSNMRHAQIRTARTWLRTEDAFIQLRKKQQEDENARNPKKPKTTPIGIYTCTTTTARDILDLLEQQDLKALYKSDPSDDRISRILTSLTNARAKFVKEELELEQQIDAAITWHNKQENPKPPKLQEPQNFSQRLTAAQKWMNEIPDTLDGGEEAKAGYASNVTKQFQLWDYEDELTRLESIIALLEKEELSQEEQRTLTKLIREERAAAAPQGEGKEDDDVKAAKKLVQQEKEKLKGIALAAARVDRQAAEKILGDQGVLWTPEEEAAERLRRKEQRRLGRERAKAAKAARPKQYTAADIVVDVPSLERDLADLEAQVALLREEMETLKKEQQAEKATSPAGEVGAEEVDV